MELERHTQLMYTSCGWFFDEISGIETIQIIAYAGRVLQLAAKLFGEPGAALEKNFLEILASAKSNVPDMGDGADSLSTATSAACRIGLEQVGAHYAISSIFRSYPEEGELFCFACTASPGIPSTPAAAVALGRAHIRSRITEAAETVAFAVLHLGDQNLSAVVKPSSRAVRRLRQFSAEASAAVSRADFPEVVRRFDRFFDSLTYSLTSLFADEQHRILRILLTGTLDEVESSLSAIYEDHASLLRFLSRSRLPRPPALAIAANFAINASLRRAIEAEPIDVIQARTWLGLAKSDEVTLDKQLLSYIVDQKMKRVMLALHQRPENLSAVEDALLVARTLRELPFDVNLWQAQNLWYDTYRYHRDKPPSAEWLEKMKELGQQMHIAVDAIVAEDGNGNGARHEPARLAEESARATPEPQTITKVSVSAS